MPTEDIARMLVTHVRGRPVNITDAVLEVAEAIQALATTVKYLGRGDAVTAMGAIEAHGVHVSEAVGALTTEIGRLADTAKVFENQI